MFNKKDTIIQNIEAIEICSHWITLQVSEIQNLKVKWKSLKTGRKFTIER